VTLFETTALEAVFKPGKTALGHHWELRTPDGEVVGRTERRYGGGVVGRTLWRTVTVTGMDADNDIRADVLDGDGQVVARLFSRNERQDRRVEVSDAGGRPIGVVHRRPGEGFVLEDPAGTAVGRIPIPEGAEAPWELVDADGRRLGLLGREAAQLARDASLLDFAVGINTITDNARDFQRTMHLGFAFSRSYAIALAQPLPADEPLRTLAVLTPVIAGYAY
jgi:hypothetical protein